MPHLPLPSSPLRSRQRGRGHVVSVALALATPVGCRVGYEPFTNPQESPSSDAGAAGGGAAATPTATTSTGGGAATSTGTRGGSGSGSSATGGTGGGDASAPGGGTTAGGAPSSTAGAPSTGGSSSGSGGDTTSVAGAAGAATGCLPTNQGREVCDGIDNDCSGEVDEDSTCPATCIGVARDGVGYMSCDDELPWPLAAAACVTRGMHLARVESEGENDFIGDAAFGGASTTGVWLSGNDIPLTLGDAGLMGDGVWEWDDGTRFWEDGAAVPGTYESWAPGEPPLGTAGGCTEMRDDAGAGSYEWFRQPCVSLRRFVCERP